MERLRTKKEILDECMIEYDNYRIRILRFMESCSLLEKYDGLDRSNTFDDILSNMYSRKSIYEILDNAIITKEDSPGWIWVKGYKAITEDNKSCFTTANNEVKEFDFDELEKCYVHEGEVVTGKNGFHLVLDIIDFKKFLPLPHRILDIIFTGDINNIKQPYDFNFYEVIALVKVDDLFNYAFTHEISSKKIIFKKQLYSVEKSNLYYKSLRLYTFGKKCSYTERLKNTYTGEALFKYNTIEDIEKHVTERVEKDKALSEKYTNVYGKKTED